MERPWLEDYIDMVPDLAAEAKRRGIEFGAYAIAYSTATEDRASLPRYDYDAPKNLPEAGDATTFVARVANRGASATGAFSYTWSIDGLTVLSDTHPSLDPGDLITLSLGFSIFPPSDYT